MEQIKKDLLLLTQAKSEIQILRNINKETKTRLTVYDDMMNFYKGVKPSSDFMTMGTNGSDTVVQLSDRICELEQEWAQTVMPPPKPYFNPSTPPPEYRPAPHSFPPPDFGKTPTGVIGVAVVHPVDKMKKKKTPVKKGSAKKKK